MDFQLSEEQRRLKALVRDLAEKEFAPKAAAWDEAGEVDLGEVAARLRDVGLLGMTIPEEYGGSGRPFLDFILALEELARVAYPPAFVLLSTCSGPVSIVMRLGSDAQRRRWLPPLVRGEMFCAVGMTEANAGSAASDVETTATLDGDAYVVDGSKLFVGGGGHVELYVVFARFGGVPGPRGVGALVIEKGTPGFEFGQQIPFMGTRGIPRRELTFTGCRVPKDNVLVAQGGFARLMNDFNYERIHNATLSLGFAQGAFEQACGYVKQRKQFGRELCEFQGVQWMIADMATELEAARLLIYRAAANADATGVADPLETSLAKRYASETGIHVCDTALQLHGAYGYSKEFPLERFYRDARGIAIATGTVQIHKNNIAARVLNRKFSQR
jgi:alkylation response protein AidB-like acyl-CoA dehydrogenase